MSSSAPSMSQGQHPSRDPPSHQLAGAARPYRSHKVPACDRCRKRKLRCAVDVPGKPCHLCQSSGAICTQTQREGSILSPERVNNTSQNIGSSSSSNNQNYANHPAKRRHVSFSSPSIGQSSAQQKSSAFASSIVLNPELRNNAIPEVFNSPTTQVEPAGSKSAMIVGPVMAEDVQMIENYMSSHSHPQRSPHNRLYDTVCNDPEDPVLYLTVPRRRQGLSQNNRPGEKQREILEQILGPLINEVVAVYFEYIHPSFPVLDEEHFLSLFRAGNRSLSAALVCELLVSALVFWNRSKTLRRYPCPDTRYAWNLAVAALQDEYLAPGMSTVHAALLDLGGRPTTSITGNTINSGRTVALSHILGLNRDPLAWNISGAEKNMRVRLWWGVLIHDRWSSFAHGVPTYITKNQYEVPVPSVAVLMTPGLETTTRIEAAQCFIALCILTEILGDILPLVYDRRQKPGTDVSKTIRRLQTDLDNWEDSDLASSLLCDRGNRPPISGSSSLKLGFLSAKMLICRIAFRNASHSTDSTLLELRQYTQATLRESARSILSFLCSLKSHHLCEFWSPYTAYHIASATIILLRCAIESNDHLVSESCKNTLRDFIDWLKIAKEREGWDLADICLAQCEGPVGQFCGGDGTGMEGGEEGGELEQGGNGGEVEGLDPEMFNFGFSGGVHTGPSVMDTQNNVNGFEYPWADLWDLF